MIKQCITLCTTALLLTSCGVLSREEMNSRFTDEHISVTKVNALNGHTLYVPDDFLNGKVISNGKNYINKGNKYIIKASATSVPFGIKTIEQAEKKYKKTFKENFIIEKIVEENSDYIVYEGSNKDKTRKVAIKACSDGSGAYVMCERFETALNTVKSLKPKETYIHNINDDTLTATVNGVSVGSAMSIDDINKAFSALANSYNDMKNSTNNVNGYTLQNVFNSVQIMFSNVTNKGAAAQQAYIDAVSAYYNAVDEYNVALSNGINFESTKKEIEEKFKTDFSGEWEKIVINNESKVSPIKKIVLEYGDNMLNSISINPDQEQKISEGMEDIQTDFDELEKQVKPQDETSGAVSDESVITDDTAEVPVDENIDGSGTKGVFSVESNTTPFGGETDTTNDQTIQEQEPVPETDESITEKEPSEQEAL